jgi:heptosyltransferase III
MRILLIRRDNIGDLVVTTPLIAGIKRTFPDCSLDVLANSYNAPVLAGNAHLEGVFAYTKLKHRMPGQSWPDALFRRWLFNRWLAQARYDHVVVAAPPTDEHALSMARRTQSPLVRFTDGLDGPRDKGKRIDYRPLADLHAVAQMSALGQGLDVPIEASSGRCELFPDPHAMERARAALKTISPSATSGATHGSSAIPSPLIALQISARRPDQRWSAENFASAARTLHRETGARFVLLWSPGSATDKRHPGDDDKATTLSTLLADVPHIAYATHTLVDLIAALSLTQLVISSDGGAMHCAAGVGKPIVALFGSSPPARWHPWGVPYLALQPSSRNVADITAAEVTEAAVRLLELSSNPVS